MSVLKKGPNGCLVWGLYYPVIWGLFQDYTTQLYGDYLINHYDRILIEQPGFNGKSEGFFVAQMMKFPLKLTVGH